MDNHRIYGEKVDVQTENVQAFYNQRARSVSERPEAFAISTSVWIFRQI